MGGGLARGLAAMDELAKDLAAVHARWAPLGARVEEIRENIRRACANRLPGESHNRANERQVEEFIARLREELPGRTYEVQRGGGGRARRKPLRRAGGRRGPRRGPPWSSSGSGSRPGPGAPRAGTTSSLCR